jgi:hypothetical protein
MFVERAGGEGMDGFLALDPRTAIVRHEELTAPADLRVLSGDIKVVTAIAEGPGLPELDLPSEERVLQEGLEGLDVVVEPCRQATLTKLTPLLNGAGVFHFAGHGDFQKQMGPRVGTYKGDHRRTIFTARDSRLGVFDATGIRLHRAPFTPERLRAGMA